MKTEVSTAANFVARLLRGTGLLSEEQLQQFRFSLEEALGGKNRLNMIFLLFLTQFNRLSSKLCVLCLIVKLIIVKNKAGLVYGSTKVH